MAAFLQNVGDGIANRRGYKHEYNPKSYRGHGGLNSTYGGPGYSQRFDPILLMDTIMNPHSLSTFPRRQPFPATAADLASVLGIASASVAEIWTCDEAAGNLTGKVANTVLTAAGSPLYSRVTPGMIKQPVSDTAEDASLWVNRNKAVELVGTTDKFSITANPAPFDLTASPFTVFVIFRAYPGTRANGCIVSREPINQRWFIRVVGGLGSSLLYRIVNSVGTTFDVTGTIQVADGAYHCAAFSWSGTVLTAITDGVSEGTATPNGTIALANSQFGIGNVVSNAMQGQVLYVAGVSVALTPAQMASFWEYGKKISGMPNAFTYTRASRLGLVTGSDANGDLACYYGASLPQMAWQKAPSAGGSNPPLLGFMSSQARANRVLQSVDPTTTWVATNVTVGANAVTSPSGMRDGHTLTSTVGATDKLEESTGSAVPANGSMSFCVHLRASAVASTSARITIFGSTGGSASTTITPGSTWVRYEVNTGALPGAFTGVIGVRIEPDISGGQKAVDIWEPFCSEEANITPTAVPSRMIQQIQSTTTAQVNGAQPVLTLGSGVSVLFPIDFGQLWARVDHPFATNNEPAAVVMALAAVISGAANRFSIIGTGDAGAGKSKFLMVTNSVVRFQVDATAALGWTADSDHVVMSSWTLNSARFKTTAGARSAFCVTDGAVNATYTTNTAAPVTVPSAVMTSITFGNDNGATSAAEGSVYRVQLYREYGLLA
jgi:concanavalin A-like lectin/glucanase superfamily protein